MEKIDLPEDDYIFDENVRKINKTDRVHADVVNPILSALFKNSIWGKRNYVTKKQLGIPEGENPSVENQVPIIPEAPNEREEFIDGDNIGIILSKVKKFFMDLKAVAFTGEYKDLLGKPTIPSVPGAIKNPYAIKVNGKTYDGSTAIDVGTMGIGYGGTGAMSAAGARSNLGLGVAATYGVANNLTTTQPGFALEAVQGKNLKEQLDEVNSNLGGVISVGTATVTSNKDGYITSMSFATQNNCDLLIITTLTDGIHIDAWYSNGWIGFARRTSDNVVMANSTFNIKYMRIKGK